jgi:anti-sigma factor RsiW
MTVSNHSDHSEHWQVRFQDAIDGALDLQTQTELNAQLQSCTSCRDEFAKLQTLHARLTTEFKLTPMLGNSFDATIMGRIDEQEHAKLAAAKQRAEQQFRERMRAFGWSWREISQRYFGSMIAAIAVFIAVAAALGSIWESLRERLAEAITSVPVLQGMGSTTLTIFIAALSVSAASLWLLRTKTQ